MFLNKNYYLSVYNNTMLIDWACFVYGDMIYVLYKRLGLLDLPLKLWLE